MKQHPAQHEARRREIARLDQASRTRALTDAESRRLEHLLYRDRYATHAQAHHARKGAA